MARWVMIERKLIVETGKDGSSVSRFVDAGKPAPAGHEGRPYTKDLDAKKDAKKSEAEE